MDTDLFQILALILLLGLLLTLFGVLQSLGAIRKTLEQRGAPEPAAEPAAQPATATPAPATGDEPETWARPTEAERAASGGGSESWGGGARTGWPAPQEAAAGSQTAAGDEPSGTTSAAPAPAGSSGARVLYGDSGLAAATPSESALRPDTVESGAGTSAAASAGAAGSEVAGSAEGAPADAGTGGAGAAAEDPQEQPFERDGRWWFRRGDELLVYEEQTGQWVPAEQPSASGSVAAAASSETVEAAAEPAAGATEGQVTTQQEAVGSFWKCPSCGAVNGSTATSCRMCFTARP